MTGLTETDYQVRQLFDLMPQLGFTARPDGYIDFYNLGWYEYTGTTYEEMQGWGWDKVHDLKYLPEVVRRWKLSLETFTAFEMKFPLRRADGVFRWFLTRVKPMLNDEGQCIRWVGINTDIDDEQRASEILELKVRERTLELALARDAAQRANELKTKFVTNISHEIRTPMSGILGMSELLTYELEGDMQNIANHILSSASNLMQLVNDLLDLSKLESGKFEILTTKIQISRVLDDVLAAFSVSAANKNLKLITNLDESATASYVGDINRIRQVLLNLVHNAVKFTESGSIVIDARVEKADGNVSFVKFSVKDTGPGISEDNQKKLFQLFVQVDGSNTRKHGGTGLGLALSKRLLEMLDGEIGLESAPGSGSNFWFTVPLVVDGDIAAAQPTDQ